jgi:signal transduction histidine kinase
MRLTELPRTTSFQLALRFLLLFGAASLALFGFLYFQTTHYILGRMENWMVRQQATLGQLDRDSMLQRLNAHVVADPSLDRPITLFSPAGERLAGTLLNLTPAEVLAMPRDTPTRLVVNQRSRRIAFIGMAHQRPSGDVLLAAVDMEQAQRFASILVDAFVSGGLVTALLGLAGAVVVGVDSVRRINGMARAIQRIVSGDLSERLPAQGRTDDLGRLAHVINGMLAELERLVQEVKGVCDNIAHDLRTPLTRLLAGLERTRRRAGSEQDYAVAVDAAIVEIREVLTTFAALLRISEVESGARRAGFTDADVSAVVADTVELYEPVAEAKGIRLLCRLPEGQPVMLRGDPSLLFEATSNLVDNALKFTPAGGTVTVRAFVSGGMAGFEVSDTGPGISAMEAAAVLRRFYRSEASRHAPGSGLGLALVAAVARLHNMDLTISEGGAGCRITLACRETVFAPRTETVPEPAPEGVAAPA